jgi:hypothetical protein
LSEPFYSFDYDPQLLARRGSGSQDFFGYCNGKQPQKIINGVNTAITDKKEKTTLVPFFNYIGSGGFFGLERTSDLNFMKAQVLTKVKNAWGGSVEFKYTLHQLSNVLTGIPVPYTDSYFLGSDANDGLRLDSIIERESFNPNNAKITKLEYANGQRFLTGGYTYMPKYLQNNYDKDFSSMFYMGQFNSKFQLVGGANHGYGKVTITVYSKNPNALLSKTETTYTNFNDATSGNLPRYLLVGGNKHYFDLPFTDKQYIKDWELGLPLVEKVYDYNNLLTQETQFTYDFTLDSITAKNKNVFNTKSLKFLYDGTPTLYTFYIGMQYDVSTQFDPVHMGYPFNVRNRYAFNDTYSPFNGKALLKSKVTKSYTTTGTFVKDSMAFVYDNLGNIKEEIGWDSRNREIHNHYVYNYSLEASLGSTISNMNQSGLKKRLGIVTRLVSNGQDKVIKASFSTFDFNSNLKKSLINKSVYAFNANAPVLWNDFIGYTGGPNIPMPYSFINSLFSSNANNYLKEIVRTTIQDDGGNVLESYFPESNVYKAMIYDGSTNYKRAEVANARYNEIAFTSFDDLGNHNNQVTLDRGNFYVSSMYVDNQSLTGNNGYRLEATSSQNNSLLGSKDLTPNKEYILSFWVKQGTALPTVFIGTNPLALGDVRSTAGAWHLYQVYFTPSVAAKVRIKGAATGQAIIDEVRLYPSASYMESNTYNPLFGVTSTTDARGTLKFSEFDKLGRMSIIRDQDGNIISKTQMVVQGSD